MKEIRYCPEHGNPGTEVGAWPCPVATEDDPIWIQTCHHFAEEIDRRIREVTDDGNFIRLLPPTDTPLHHLRMVQEYRNHLPYGEPRPLKGHGNSPL